MASYNVDLALLANATVVETPNVRAGTVVPTFTAKALLTTTVGVTTSPTATLTSSAHTTLDEDAQVPTPTLGLLGEASVVVTVSTGPRTLNEDLSLTGEADAEVEAATFTSTEIDLPDLMARADAEVIPSGEISFEEELNLFIEGLLAVEAEGGGHAANLSFLVQADTTVGLPGEETELELTLLVNAETYLDRLLGDLALEVQASLFLDEPFQQELLLNTGATVLIDYSIQQAGISSSGGVGAGVGPPIRVRPDGGPKLTPTTARRSTFFNG